VKKSYLFGAAVLALLLCVNLVVSAPARLLYRVLPGEQLMLHGLSGTVWRGSASSVLLRLPQGYLQLGTVHWALRPWSLLLLAPHLELHSEWGNQTLAGELVLRGQRDLDVISLEGQVGADLLHNFAPVAIDGMLKLQLAGLQLRDGLPHSVSGRLVWQDAGWRSPRGLVPLGSYALDVQQAPGEALHGQVITLAGPLQANGSVELLQRHYAVDIQLSGEANLDAQLTNMLAQIAVPEGAGYRISVKGDF
jgi:general secretion pathway protein N